MFEHLSLQELVASLEKVHGRILIPDPEIRWLWDSRNHQYFQIDEADRPLILECLEKQGIRSQIRKDASGDSLRYFEDIYIPVRAEGGRTQIIIKLSEEVTDKVLHEQRLSAERDKLAAITEFSPDAIIILHENGAVLAWNHGAVQLFGYTSPEITGRDASILFANQKELGSLMNLLQSLPTDQQLITQHMTRCRHRDGSLLHSQVSLFPLPGHGSPIKEFVCIFRDMTRQKQLEEEIARNIDNISKINEISSFIHSSLDKEEILNMILVAVTAGQGFKFNRAFLFLLSDDRTRLEGKKAIGPSNAHEAGILWQELNQKNTTLRDILTSYRSRQDGYDFHVNQMIAGLSIPLIPCDKEHDLQEYAAFLDAFYDDCCILVTAEQPHYLTPGVRRIFQTDQLAIIPLSSREGTIGVLVVDNAITGRPIQQQELQSLKMFANQISTAIQNAVTHDQLQRNMEELKRLHESLQISQQQMIRNEKLAVVGSMSAKLAHEIRNPIVAIGGFIRRILAGKYYPENELFLKIILEETARMEGILNATLSLTQTKEPVKKIQPLLPAVNRAVAIISPRFEKYPIRVNYDIDDHLPNIAYDFDMILQVLINIMVNSAEAMPGGGILGISLKHHDGAIRLTISDTGEGMDEEQLKKIFDPFYTTKQRGSGLGLIVVMDFLDRHGFTYKIDSAKGKGTKFTIDFR